MEGELKDMRKAPFAALFALVLPFGGESVRGTVDDWFTRTPDVGDSDAERVVDSTDWLIPSPYGELVSALVGGFAGFWTARRRQAKK